jgi:hypothetical protein
MSNESTTLCSSEGLAIDTLSIGESRVTMRIRGCECDEPSDNLNAFSATDRFCSLEARSRAAISSFSRMGAVGASGDGTMDMELLRLLRDIG